MSRESDYDKLHRSPEIRAAAIKRLETLSEKFPMLRLGQLMSNATTGRDLFNLEDDELLRMLDHMYTTYMQFRAAGIRQEQMR